MASGALSNLFDLFSGRSKTADVQNSNNLNDDISHFVQPHRPSLSEKKSTQFLSPLLKRRRDDDDNDKQEHISSATKFRVTDSSDRSEKENVSLSKTNIIRSNAKSMKLELMSAGLNMTKNLPNLEQGNVSPPRKKKPLSSKKKSYTTIKKSVWRGDKDKQISENFIKAPDSSRIEPNFHCMSTDESTISQTTSKLKLIKQKSRQRRFTISGDVRIQQLQSHSKHWTPQLDFVWGEVMFILKTPIKTEKNLIGTVHALDVGLAFIDELKKLASSMKVLNGKLIRWLLPYDDNSRIDTQSSTCQSALESMPEEFAAYISEDMVHYLVKGANTVRKLIRVKIADDNDLEQARSAVELAHSFFKELYSQASKCEMTPFQLLEASNQM